MKKLFTFFLVLCCLSGCAGGVSSDFYRPTDATPLSLMLTLNDRTIHSEATLYTDVENSDYTVPDEATASALFSEDNPLDLSLIESYAIRSSEKTKDEIIILTLKEESGAEKAKLWLSSRIAARCKAFSSASTDQNSLINQKGKFVYCVLCDNAPAVGTLLLSCISAEYGDA